MADSNTASGYAQSEPMQDPSVFRDVEKLRAIIQETLEYACVRLEPYTVPLSTPDSPRLAMVASDVEQNVATCVNLVQEIRDRLHAAHL